MAIKKQAVTTETKAQTKSTVTPEKSAVKSAPATTKKAVSAPKKERKVVRYFKEVRAELRKVVWPSRQTALRLTGIVLGVTVAMSAFLGLVDWLFSKLFALIIGA